MIVPEQFNKNSLNRYLYSTPFYSDFKGGLNKINNQAELNVNELYEAKNVMFNLDMGVIPRFGVAKLIPTQFPQQNVEKITGLYQARFKAGSVVFACGGSYIYAWLNNSWVQIGSNLQRNFTVDYSLTMFNDKLIICDGVNKPLAVSFNGSSFTVEELTNAPDDVKSCKFVTSWFGRLIFGVNGTNKIYLTDINDINSFPVNGVISVGGVDDSDSIMAITPLFGSLIIFKKNSIYQFYGNSIETFTVNLINNSVGCLVEKCCVTAEGYVYFFGPNGLWRISNSYSAEYLSNKILPFFQYLSFSSSGINKPVIAYNQYFRQIWLSVCFANHDERDRVIVYDIVNNCFSYYEFYKDQTKNLNPLVLSNFVNQKGINKLIGANGKIVYEYDVANFNGDDGNISYAEIETKLFNLGDPQKFKSLKSYIALGDGGFGFGNSGNTKDISSFDALNDTYLEVTSDLVETRGSSCVVYNNKLYISGGYAEKSLKTFRVLDTQNNSIQTLPEMPIPLAFHSSVVYNNKIYVFGGFYDGFVNNKILVYDLVNNEWSILNESYNMPTARWACEAFLVGDKVYVLGGVDGFNQPTNKNECFDLTNLTWSTKQNLPRGLAYFSGCVFGNLIYIFGGYPASTNGKKVVVYDTTNNTYIDKGDIIPYFVMLHRVYKTSNNNCLIVGGYYFNGLREIYQFNATNDSFSLKYILPYEKYWFSGEIVNGKCYMIGGIAFNTPKITFKATNDFKNFISYETNLKMNVLAPIDFISNGYYKFYSIKLKTLVNYGFIRINSISLDYFMWHRRV